MMNGNYRTPKLRHRAEFHGAFGLKGRWPTIVRVDMFRLPPKVFASASNFLENPACLALGPHPLELGDPGGARTISTGNDVVVPGENQRLRGLDICFDGSAKGTAKFDCSR